MSDKPSLEAAVKEVARNLSGLPRADLVFVFVSTDYASDLIRLIPLLRLHLNSSHWLGCVGVGVIGTNAQGKASELEMKPALRITMLRLPGGLLKTFYLNPEDLPDLDGPSEHWKDWVGVDSSQNRSMLLFVDPTSPFTNDLISGLDYAYPSTKIVGGVGGSHHAPSAPISRNF